MRKLLLRTVLPGSILLAVGAISTAMAGPANAGTAHAGHKHGTAYVSPHGKSGAPDRNCRSAAFTTISAAVSAVAAGGKVVICGGTYEEDVAVAKPLSLIGQRHATIDATGKINGILVTASHVRVTGLTVANAIGEGVLVNHAAHVTIAGNVVKNNDLGALPVNPVPNTYPECQAQGGVPGDCGEGIHLMGATYATVAGNVSTGNSGGILLSDETGPAAHNHVSGNRVSKNLYDCGITVVSHNPAGFANGRRVPSAAGTYANVISGNVITGNGTAGEGAGVVLATPLPGGAVYDNLVIGNKISGNGMSGVTLHSHAPGQDLNGNVVRGNWIGVNNLKGDRDFSPHVDLQTTGVLAATIAPVSIEVSGNVIKDDHFGIWTTGPVTVGRAQHNAFIHVAVPVAQG